MRYDRILSAALANPWAIRQTEGDVLASILARHIAGDEIDTDEFKTEAKDSDEPNYTINNAVAVLPLQGQIFPRSNLMTEFSGATSIEIWIKDLQALVDNRDVRAIVLDINSPGGSTDGIAEAGQRMYELRGEKPIVAVSNFLCASAAYWMAAQADEVIASPSSVTGSIGVFGLHVSMARAFETAGLDPTIIRAPEGKVEMNDFEALTPVALSAAQDMVDEFYSMFVAAVAQGRGVPQSDVRGGYGEGRAVGSRVALQAGLVDAVATLDETVARMQRPQARAAVMRRRNSAESDVETTVATSVPTPSPEQMAAAVERRIKESAHV